MSDTLRAALAAAVAEPVEIHQFRKFGCTDWYDGSADHEDGGGPYEERVLYAAPPQREPYDQTALGLCNACGWKAVGPDGCLNCAPQREREPLTDEQILGCVRSVGTPTPMGLTRERGPYEVTEPSWFLMQLVRAIERAHGIAPASAPKEQ